MDQKKSSGNIPQGHSLDQLCSPLQENNLTPEFHLSFCDVDV